MGWHPKALYPAERHELLRQLFAPACLAIIMVLGDGSAEKAYTLRLYHKPLVSWIWFGAVMMALGDLYAQAAAPQPARKAE